MSLAGIAAALMPAAAAESLAGPYAALVERVIDGDSLEARVVIWLGQEVRTTVRLAGVDTAELRGPCPAAREIATAAKAFLAARVEGGSVTLTGVEADKFGGRVVAHVTDAAGDDLGEALVAAGLARRYDGRRPDWCKS
jgi:endonuclease YncB( thermonuclease family)